MTAPEPTAGAVVCFPHVVEREDVATEVDLWYSANTRWIRQLLLAWRQGYRAAEDLTLPNEFAPTAPGTGTNRLRPLGRTFRRGFLQRRREMAATPGP